LSKLVLFGEKSSRRAIREYLTHFHTEQNLQGKGNILLLPVSTKVENRIDGPIHCKERLGGLLKYYHREAAWVFWPCGGTPGNVSGDPRSTPQISGHYSWLSHCKVLIQAPMAAW